MKPTDDLPAANLASLIRVNREATTGDDAEVPKTRENAPSMPENRLI